MRSLGMDAFLASHDLDQPFQNTKGNLSGGEKQKLALARVLVEQKNVIFLDEATANMDKASSQQILSQLLQTDGLTVISIEHKVSPEILPLYDTILELKDKRLVERALFCQVLLCSERKDRKSKRQNAPSVSSLLMAAFFSRRTDGFLLY